MITFYKVIYHRLDIDDFHFYGFNDKLEAKEKFDSLLASVHDSDVSLNKFVLRLSIVRVGPKGFYEDKCLESF